MALLKKIVENSLTNGQWYFRCYDLYEGYPELIGETVSYSDATKICQEYIEDTDGEAETFIRIWHDGIMYESGIVYGTMSNYDIYSDVARCYSYNAQGEKVWFENEVQNYSIWDDIVRSFYDSTLL